MTLRILFLSLGFFSNLQAQENLRPKLDNYLKEITAKLGISRWRRDETNNLSHFRSGFINCSGRVFDRVFPARQAYRDRNRLGAQSFGNRWIDFTLRFSFQGADRTEGREDQRFQTLLSRLPNTK